MEGKLIGEGLRIALVASRFNDQVVSKLIDGALDCLSRHGVEDIEIYKVPGAFEIPLTASELVKAKKFDAVVALGAVIRGDTPHFEYVAGEVTRGIGRVTLDTGIPVIFGVVTADDLESALERAGGKMGNKGFEAALSAIEMANLLKKIKVKGGGE